MQPHPPENVNVTFTQNANSPYFLVRWRPPRDADTRSGWVTIKYEVRLKIENSRDEEDWEVRFRLFRGHQSSYKNVMFCNLSFKNQN